MLNEEVQTDSQTVKELFNDWLELIVPAGSLSWGELTEQKKELHKLMLILKKVGETNVNIVLNTHGSPGKYDIDVCLITELVQQLSAAHIKINTIYALMCDGFTQQNATNSQRTYKTSSSFLETTLKPSSMAILRSKLNNLETKMEQSIEIKGFAYPYTPNEAKEMIMSFLLNKNAGQTIYVHTREQKKEDFNYLLNYIRLCRRKDVNVQDPAYNKAANVLGTLLSEIKKHIDEYLNGFSEQLYEGSVPLFKEILDFSKADATNLTIPQFDHQYKRWIKEYKLTSTTRLNILEGYCQYQQRAQNELILLPHNERLTFFVGKIELDDEPLSGVDVLCDECPGKAPKL